jgi:hypothetical protein
MTEVGNLDTYLTDYMVTEIDPSTLEDLASN